MPQSIHDADQTIEAFLTAAGAKQPTPGGGSVSALVGALSAAMGEMTLNYSVGRKDVVEHDAQLRETLAEFVRARNLLLGLMVEDQAAYDALTRIRKEGGAGDPRFAPALLASIRVPQAIAATGVAILELADSVADRINPFLASDFAVCAELAMATVRCASYNVRVNLPDIGEEGERTRFERDSARVLSNALAALQRLLPRIWLRANSS